MDLALNNLQRLICHKTQQNQPTSCMAQLYFEKNKIAAITKTTVTNKHKTNKLEAF